MCLTQWKISSPIIHRGLNMWRNYVLQIPRIVESFLSVFRIASFVRFDSIVHKGWYEFAYVCTHTHTQIARACTTRIWRHNARANANRSIKKKKDEAAFTRYSTHFSSFSPRFSKMSYQSVSDFIFRFTLAIRRCTTIRSFSCFCQPALAQYRPLRSFIRENHAFCVCLSRVTAPFFLSFSFFITF